MQKKRSTERFRQALLQSGIFDRKYYLEANPDVVANGIDPFHHYEIFGRFEMRAPGPNFNPDWYSAQYASVLGSHPDKIEPCEYYVLEGIKKGHSPTPPANTVGNTENAAINELRANAHARKVSDPSYRSKGILIRTYDKDAPRLYFALASIQRFCTGYDSVTVVCQASSAYAVRPIVEKFDFVSLKICPAYPNDYIGQQITKLRSHLYVQDDLIYHMDSDCMFRDDTDLSYYLIDGLPILQYRSYDELYRLGAFVPWQEPTSRFLRRQVDFEFMCGFPFAYPRELTLDLERWFEDSNGYSYDEIEKHIPFVNNFSEYNLMGAFSYFNNGKYNHLQAESASFDLRMNQHCRADRTKREFQENELDEMQALLK